MGVPNRLAGKTLVLGWDLQTVLVISDRGRGEWVSFDWKDLTPEEREEVAKHYQDWFAVADFWLEPGVLHR